MKTILITGSTGFVGRRVSRLFSEKFKNAQIFCVARPENSGLEVSGRRVLKKLEVAIISADLSNSKDLLKLPKRIDYVIHLAANGETSERDHSFNDVGMKLLLGHLDLKQLKHFIFTSTTAVYSGRLNSNNPITEQTKIAPSNEYGRSKIKAEQLLIQKSKQYKFPITIFRLSTVFGRQTRDNGLFDSLKKLIPQRAFISRLNWPGLTGLVFVDDVASLLYLAVKTMPKKKQNLYIVTTESLTMFSIAKLMSEQLKVSLNPINLPNIFWKIVGFFSQYFAVFEFLPSKLYNWLWRFNLIANNTLYCSGEKVKKDFPRWKQARFEEKAGEVTG